MRYAYLKGKDQANCLTFHYNLNCKYENLFLKDQAICSAYLKPFTIIRIVSMRTY